MGQVTAFDRVGWRRSGFEPAQRREPGIVYAGRVLSERASSSLALRIASASWSPRLTAQLYDVRRDQQLAGRAGQPDGSPFLLFELGCEIVPFATHNSQIFILLPSCLVRAVLP